MQPVNFAVSSFGESLEDKFKESHPDYQKFDLDFNREAYENTFKKEDLIYLTADAEEVMEDVEEDKLYIIGGLVDRNRHKVIIDWMT